MSTDVPDVGMDMGMDMASPDMGNCPAQNGAAGDPCLCDQQCGVGVCVGETATTPGRCSLPCATRQDCGAGAGACLQDPDSGLDYCFPDDTGTACTTNTAADPSKCVHDICLQAGPNHSPKHFCSFQCETASDCAVGHACSPVRCEATANGFACLPRVTIARSGALKASLLGRYTEDFNVCVRMGVNVAAGCDSTVPTNEFVCASSVCDFSADRCTAECIDTPDCAAGGCVDRDVSDPNFPIRVCDI